MSQKRTGEKAGWIGGWTGSFIWVIILAGLLFYRQKFEQGLVGTLLILTAFTAVTYYAPWRHPVTPYWKLMLAPYALFFIAMTWAAWSFGGMEALGLNWWNLLWLLPALSPFGLLSNRRWTQPSTRSGDESARD